tara:strand:+ start:653 stop:1042 length:390 start_codon:yes stop_codon:yes gene_type:complete
MSVIIGVLCGLYGTYCISFCCAVGGTLIQEHIEKKQKIKLEIEKQYQQTLLDERMKLEKIHYDIHRKSMQNVKLYTIVEEYEEYEDQEESKKTDNFYFSEDDIESSTENEGLLGYYYQNNFITEKKELA